MATWAPFLLVHLGGPDTITAFSLEDNELWKRHLLDLVSQLMATFYVVHGSWNETHLNFVYILVMLVGIIKYVERTWSLRSGSTEIFRESILSPPDPGPNYAKFMDDYTAKIAEGYEVSVGEVIETAPIVLGPSEGENESSDAASLLRDGFYFFKIFECLFADLILSFQDHKNSQNFFQNIKNWNYAFQVIEVELGLMYDMLYTKAVLTYSRLGFFLKFVSVLCTLSAFLTFYFLIHKAHINHDHVITFVLFSGAIYLEIHAFIVLLSSSWAMHWFSKNKNRRVNNILYKSISWFQRVFKLSHTNRWSNSVSKFNLLRFCLKDEPIQCIQIQKCLHIYQHFEKSYYKHTEAVPPELKEFIFKQLKRKSEKASSIGACKELCAHRGDRVLANWSCHAIDWSVKVEFDQSILLWHIATDLCYYSDINDKSSCVELQTCKSSQLLSDYMLYLLVMCPFMLPNGIGQIRFQDTCAELDELLKERSYISEKSKVCEMLLRVNTEVQPLKVKGDRSKSVLFGACILAKSLQSLEMEKNDKWKMILDVWVEIMCYAACHCRGLDHAKQLSQGGELLTHVWLLMAHLGITEQFQISRGHARAKLLLG